MNQDILKDFQPLPLDLQGWNGNSPAFKELIAMVRPATIIEVGSWKGQSSVTMAKACRELGLTTKMYCVDTWLGAVEFMKDDVGPDRDLMKKHGYPQVYYQFLSNIVRSGVADMIEPVPNTSFIASRVLPKADLIYIDGDHEYESVWQDMNLYWEKLNQGGVMFGDDYFTWGGVKKAVDQFSNFVRAKTEFYDNNFWVIRK